MHIEKNVFKNIFKTVMDVKEKIKDNIKAIMDITFYLYRSYKHRLLHTHTHTQITYIPRKF